MATTLGQGPKTIKACEGIAQQPVVDFDRDPRESILTVAVFFAVAAGYRWGIPKPYLDLIEEKEEGRIERRVYWNFDGGSNVEFDGEKVPFGQFWRRIHDFELCRDRSALQQLARGLSVLSVMPAADRSAKLLYWAGHASLADQARAIFAETAKINDDFRAAKMPRFIYVEQARGKEINRAYIPINATAEERTKVLARAGIS